MIRLWWLWLSFFVVEALCSSNNNHNIEEECQVYMALSTIPNAGVGMYSAVERHPGDKIGEGDVCIPLLDLEWHSAEDPNFANPFADYVWFGNAVGMAFEVGPFELVAAFWPGLDAAVNCHAALVNVERALPQYDPEVGDQNVQRSTHHSVGSFTPYHNGTSYVTQYIPAGGELFKDYGGDWFRLRNYTGPVVTDYKKAQRLMDDFEWRIPLEFQQAVYEDLIIETMQETWWNQSPILQALPTDWKSAQKATADKKNGLRSNHLANATRSIEWLREHGSCADNIDPRISTMDGAGRGAFAKRAMVKDSIIATSPVIHVVDKTVLYMHNIVSATASKNASHLEKEEKIGDQLVQNYCFGHGETTMILCPYGAGVNNINHGSSTSSRVNVRMAWSKDGFLNHDEKWLSTPLEEWKLHDLQSRLAVDYIATRDIQPGEELFMDYGTAWEEAWNLHMEDWDPATDYRSAHSWNEIHKGEDLVWTEVEALRDPYPDNLELRCHGGLAYFNFWKYKSLEWGGHASGQDPEYGHPCRVIERRQAEFGNYVYDVVMSVVADWMTVRTERLERFNVPRNAIRWFDKPHTTDLHLSKAFRHTIGLPDVMLPKSWRNIKQATKEEEERDTANPEWSCELYLAESTIPNAGLGIFAARPFEVGEPVGNGDKAIPLLEFSWHNGFMESESNAFFDPTYNYVWDGRSYGMGNEVASEDISLYWPGINCAVNCYSVLINLHPSYPVYDEAGVHRSKNPGAGAFSPYHLGISEASRFIPAGGELFKDYGDSWFTTREEFEGVPVGSNFADAQELLKIFFELNNADEKVYDVLLAIVGVWDERLGTALPNAFDNAKIAYESEIAVLHQPLRTRDISWLKENGRCFDNIVPDRSTLENAGHGAFAKRFISEGTMLSGSPLQHIFRSLLDMYDSDFNETEGTWQRGKKSTRQLFLNYCFGHSESILLLCPYGAGVNYINHNKTLSNVKIQWAPDRTSSHNSSWLSMTPKEMEFNFKTNLGFDYVATKDISEGEEIFLDYGDDWEEAWIGHSNSWRSDIPWSSYVSAASWNELMAEKPLRTDAEEQDEPYPSNLSLQCHSSLASHEIEGPWWEKWDFEWSIYEYGFPCYIISRQGNAWLDSSVTYNVVIEARDEAGYPTENITRSGIPRGGIRFFDRPNTKDFHLKEAFRHEIGIPNEMVPEVWRGREEESNANGKKDADKTADKQRQGAVRAHKQLPKHLLPKPASLSNEL